MPEGVQGYFWDFPVQIGDCAGRTWGVFDSRACLGSRPRSLAPVIDDAFARQGIHLDGVPLAGHPLRWFDPHGPFSIPNVLLVGDAAGVDPLLGEGISFALGYGEIAAQELMDAFGNNQFDFEDYRRRVLTHRVGRYLRRRAWVARLLYRLRSRALLRCAWHVLGFPVGKLAEWLLVDWGTPLRSL